MYDIIPDIHGQFAKLQGILDRLGYIRMNGTWRHADTERRIVFLGDYIDRGPDNENVIRTVRELIDAGRALAIMGNHELNAIHYHSRAVDGGAYLRPHTEGNTIQHASFLREFPLGDAKTQAQIDWMKGLPLFLELEDFRVVHACWSAESIAALEPLTKGGVLREDVLLAVASKAHALYRHVEIVTKGPELRLPGGCSYEDRDKKIRHDVRVAWWKRGAKTWRDIALSVKEDTELPVTPLKEELKGISYAETEKPVFFGHYWMTGIPVLQGTNVLCLDYSAGEDGPLLAYRFNPEHPTPSLENIVQADQ